MSKMDVNLEESKEGKMAEPTSGTGPQSDNAFPDNGHSVKRKSGFISRLKSKNFFLKSNSVNSLDMDNTGGVQEKSEPTSTSNTNLRDLFTKNGRSRSFPGFLQFLQGKTSSESESLPDRQVSFRIDQVSPGKATTRRSKSVPKRMKLKNSLSPVGESFLEQSSLPHEGRTSFLSDSPPSASTNNLGYHLHPRQREDSPVFASPISSFAGEEELKDDSMTDSFETPLAEIPSPKLEENVVKVEERKPEADTRISSGAGRPGKQSWVNSVTIFLYEGKNLPAMDRNGYSDPFCKFKLGAEKYRSRIVYKTLNPSWMEQFDLFVYDAQDNRLEISVWDWDRGVRNDFIGNVSLDLATLESEKLHDLWLNITDSSGLSCGSLHLSIMISGKKLFAETVNDDVASRSEIGPLSSLTKYDIQNSLTDLRDVGSFTVKVFRGACLRAADLNGKSDPYCVLQLVNTRMQTQVELKTLDPEWNREFTFPVHDVHSVLEITVFDMDQDKKSDFLGRVDIPLLKVHNNERRWYALKDQKLRGRSKGSILLEMDLVYNPLRAAIRTIKPREARFDGVEPKFQRQLFVSNVTRMRSIGKPLLEIGQEIRSCLNWESRRRSITAFLLYMMGVCFFEVWMVPVVLLAYFLKHYIRQQLTPTSYARDMPGEEQPEGDDDSTQDNEEEDSESDPNRMAAARTKAGSSNGLVQKVKVAQEQLRMVQNSLGYLADLCERMYNTVHFTVPWLSHLAMLVLAGSTILLYFVPLRVILLVWGVHKFTKKLRSPRSSGNNELLDFFSRVYTHQEVGRYRELRPRDVPSVMVANG